MTCLLCQRAQIFTLGSLQDTAELPVAFIPAFTSLEQALGSEEGSEDDTNGRGIIDQILLLDAFFLVDQYPER